MIAHKNGGDQKKKKKKKATRSREDGLKTQDKE
jgi:hypothetical protein